MDRERSVREIHRSEAAVMKVFQVLHSARRPLCSRREIRICSTSTCLIKRSIASAQAPIDMALIDLHLIPGISAMRAPP